MNKWKLCVAAIALSLTSSPMLAKKSTPQPAIFLDSVTVGGFDIDYFIPATFHQVDQHVFLHGQTVKFVPLKQDKENWSQQIILSLTHRPQITAYQKIRNIQDQYAKTYEKIEIDGGRYDRNKASDSNYQQAATTITYSKGDQTWVSHFAFYSDQEVLIGSQVTSLAGRSKAQTQKDVKQLSKSITSLTE